MNIYFKIQAGLTSLEVKFDEWEWEEETEVFTLEHVGFGKTFIHRLVITTNLFFSSDNQCCWSYNINYCFHNRKNNP